MRKILWSLRRKEGNRAELGGILKELYVKLLEINDMHNSYVDQFLSEDRGEDEKAVFFEYLRKYTVLSSYLKVIFEVDLSYDKLLELDKGIIALEKFCDEQKVIQFDFIYFYKLDELAKFIEKKYLTKTFFGVQKKSVAL